MDAGSSKLAVCPFCGDTASREFFSGQGWAIFCDGCHASAATMPSKSAAIAAWNRRVTPQPEAQQPSDGLVEQCAKMADGLRGSMWANRNEVIALLDAASAALKTRTSPETTFADELAERVRRAFSNDAAALITGELSDGRRYVVMPFDHYESELLKRQKRGAEQALRTSPETVELLKETRGTMAEQVRRCERWGKSHHEMDAAISAIDAHLSNTPGKESSDG